MEEEFSFCEWAKEALETACQCGLTPSEFYGLNYHEFEAVVKGYEAREKQEMRRVAYLALNLQGLYKHPKSIHRIMSDLGIKNETAKPGEKVDVKRQMEFIKKRFAQVKKGAQGGGKEGG